MARRRKTPISKPLPQVEGIDPVHLIMPEQYPSEYAATDKTSPTLADYLTARFFPQDPHYVPARLERGEIVDDSGTPYAPHSPFIGGSSVWYHRELSPEPDVPSDLTVLFEDEWILAVDKPHFLATTPRGMFVKNTALANLRVAHDLPELSPVHRLDRATAGVLVFAKVPPARAPLQMLFERRQVRKTYEAVTLPIANLSEGDQLTVRSRIDKEHGHIQVEQTNVQILPGEHPPLAPETHAQKRKRRQSGQAFDGLNAESRITCLSIYDLDSATVDITGLNNSARRLTHLQLEPHSGKTHQLRAHLLAAGSPILGDTIYPELQEHGNDNPALPLQLLARTLEFIHPLTGEDVMLRSQRTLALAPPPGPGVR